MSKKLWFLLVLFVCGTAVFAQTTSFTTYLSAQSASNGGLYASQAGTAELLLQNPAMFALSQVLMQFADLNVLMNGAGLSMFSSILTGAFDFSNLGLLLANLFDEQGRAYILFDVAGPINFAYSGKGIGFGIYNQTVMSINVGSVYYANISAREDIFVTGGVAYRGDIGAGWWYAGGLKVKGLLRTELYYADSLLNFMTVLGTADFFNSALPFLLTTGIGFDAGAQVGLYDVLTFGIQCDDAFSTLFTTEFSSLSGFWGDPAGSKITSYVNIPLPNLTAGITAYPFLNFMEQHSLKWNVSVGYSHMLDLFLPLSRNPILFLSAGTELTILERLKIAVGVREALLAAGITLDLDTLCVSTAVFGRELGIEPGERPVYIIMVNVSVKR
ncbi:MAG TPA: hypothetical protein PK074_00220 [Spirochaetales bacterium]|nr:hypothetical protein [Spirochaetales bacterium]